MVSFFNFQLFLLTKIPREGNWVRFSCSNSALKCLLRFRSTFVKSSFTTFDLILQKCFKCTVGGWFVSFRAYNRHLWKSNLQKHSVTFYLYFQLSLNKKCQKTIYLGFIWLVMMCFEFLTEANFLALIGSNRKYT